MPECPSPDRLAELVLGRLLEPHHAEVEEHVATCAACRQVVAALARSSVLPPAPPGEGLEPGRAFGRFTVIHTLGVGAMGTVYAAHDPQLDRRVALKVLHADAQSTRLLGEARAMARVADPNVTQVHEVATAEDRVYLAMELVEGETLRQWLGRQPRSWREVLPVLLQAGRGLAAAHAAGVTHFDFKPENVLVGNDGRVRVTDFGLARMRASSTPPPQLATPAGQSQSQSPGTPAYMSPEQFRAETCGPAADQFSFCVVAWEALFRRAPFDAGEPPTVVTLSREVLAGRIRAAPSDSDVPKQVVRVLQRGLSTSAVDRFADLPALIGELSAPLNQRRRWPLAVAAVALASVAFLAAAGIWSQRASLLCGAGERRLGSAWDAAQRQRAATAFSSAKAGWATQAWASGERSLNAYRDAWLSMFREACEATRVSGEQSAEVLELRMACLSSRQQELLAAGVVLENGNGETFSRAVAIAEGLTPISTCADVEGLRAQVRPPADEGTRKAVDDARAVLTQAIAVERAGRYPQALALAREALSLAELTKYLPAIAGTRAETGRLQLLTEPDDRATATLEAAFYEAQSCGHDELAGRVAALLMMHTGFTMKRKDDALRWERMARAVLARRPVPLNELILETGRSRWLSWEQQYEDALAAALRANELSRQIFGAASANSGARQSDLGRVLTSMHRFDEAEAAFRKSLQTLEAALGPEHPELGATRNGLANLLLEAGRVDEALAEQKRVLAILRATHGPSSNAVAMTLSNIAELDGMQGRHAEALEGFRQALQISLALGAQSDPVLAQRYGDVAIELEALERIPEAIEALKSAVAAAETAAAGDLEGVLLRCDLARLELDVNQPAAVADANMAFKALEGRESEDPANAAACELIIADVWWTVPNQRSRAKALATAARAHVEPGSEIAGELDAWLREHR